MLKRCLVVLAAVLLAAVVIAGAGLLRRQRATVPAASYSPAAEPGPFDGTWACVSQVVDGDPAPADRTEKLKLVVSKDELVFVNGDRERTMSYTLDGSASPQQIDLWLKESDSEGIKSVHHGILTVDSDTLTICAGLCKFTMSDDRHLLGADSDRPTEFTARPGSSRILTVFKRQKPE